MFIYILSYSVVILSYIFVSKNKISKILYCYSIGFLLSIVVGLRHVSMGLRDTVDFFIPRFHAIATHGLEYAIAIDKDPAFQIMTYWYTRIFGTNEMLYLFLISLPYFMAVSYLINKYSKNVVLSFIIFMSLHYYTLSFTLLRQAFAMAFLILSFTFIIDRKFLYFFLTIFIASFFHQVSIIFLLAYPLSKIKFNDIYLLIIPIITLSVLVAPGIYMSILNYIITDNGRFNHIIDNTVSTNLVVFFINLFFLAVGMLFHKNNKDDKLFNVLLFFSFITTSISPLTMVFREAGRIGYLFGIFNIILLPNVIERIKDNRSRDIINVSSTALFVIYFFFFLGENVNVIPYFFYWDNPLSLF